MIRFQTTPPPYVFPPQDRRTHPLEQAVITYPEASPGPVRPGSVDPTLKADPTKLHLPRNSKRAPQECAEGPRPREDPLRPL